MYENLNIESLTENQINILLRELDKYDKYDNYFEYFKAGCKLIKPELNWNFSWHHKYLCDIFQREVIRMKNGLPRKKHIIINVPPRSSKSLIFSVFSAPWAWQHMKGLNILNLSYADGLAEDHSNILFSYMNSEYFQNEYKTIKMKSNLQAKNNFEINGGGRRIASGFNSLGKGGDIIIVDDPNNILETTPASFRKTITHYQDIILGRLNDKNVGVIFIIQQRVNENDLSGFLLKNFPDLYEHICLPAELTKDVSPMELQDNYTNGLLWEHSLGLKVLEEQKRQMGTLKFQGQYNQTPAKEGGNIIKGEWIRSITQAKFDEILEVKKIFPIWNFVIDTAQTMKKVNDPSGILCFTEIENIFYIKKYYRERLEFLDLVRKIQNIIDTEGSVRSKVYIEPKSNGKDVVNYLKNKTKLNVIEMSAPTTDKMARFKAVSPIIESGRLVIIEDNWNDDYVNELMSFPNGAHDEAVDLTAYMMNDFYKKGGDGQYMFSFL